ncbi:MAG: prephenate dehydrogenase/arogenate dehydrogenase family protein [Betaproteobacteria bacterium]|nr:prephenate dehydrogenase/arogenate dehydrogenase family protein [Betaproteobacteria bacterium]
MAFSIDKLVVIGVGLIGGSFALALKEAGVVRRVVGVGRHSRNIERALELKVIDEAGAIDERTLQDAQLVMLAMPVGQMPPVMQAIAPLLAAGTIVSDAGSTKQDVVLYAREAFGGAIAQFVPGHPIAGTEHSGAAAAFAELYRQRKVVLTPVPENAADTVRYMESAWAACGARLHRMRPEEHDSVFATVSHLPHLLAYAMVDYVSLHANADQLFSYAAGGFRDFTRIASSHPEMWRDICMANRVALSAELGLYRSKLAALQAALDSKDAAKLETVFSRAREARESWLRGNGK